MEKESRKMNNERCRIKSSPTHSLIRTEWWKTSGLSDSHVRKIIHTARWKERQSVAQSQDATSCKMKKSNWRNIHSPTHYHSHGDYTHSFTLTFSVHEWIQSLILLQDDVHTQRRGHTNQCSDYHAYWGDVTSFIQKFLLSCRQDRWIDHAHTHTYTW